MSWIKKALLELSADRSVQVRPLGGSMRGRIESGQLVTLVPASSDNVDVDDVVLVRWKGNYLLHLIKEKRKAEVLIGNNLGKINGWVANDAIIAKVIEVEDLGE